MATLKEHVSGNVEFQFYREGNLYYKTHLGLEFPIPINDTDGATFLNKDKGILYMRWIRKWVS